MKEIRCIELSGAEKRRLIQHITKTEKSFELIAYAINYITQDNSTFEKLEQDDITDPNDTWIWVPTSESSKQGYKVPISPIPVDILDQVETQARRRFHMQVHPPTIAELADALNLLPKTVMQCVDERNLRVYIRKE